MKTRRVVAGGAVLAALAVLGTVLSFLGGLFPGIGGTGENGEGTGEPGTVQVTMDGSESPAPPETPDKPAEVDLSGAVDIVIDGERYLARTADGERREVSLEEVGRLVAKAPGNADGIRIRIARKRSSLRSAERDLEQLLTDAGLADDAVRWVKEPVD